MRDSVTMDPEAFSSDLMGGFSNAWYSSLDRDPFEYEPTNPVGPIWALKASKFDKDLSGVEIPKINCSSPFASDYEAKYQVGARTKTVINLLDMVVGYGESPLKNTAVWTDVDLNPLVEIWMTNAAGEPVSVNGLTMTDGFDFVIYIKEEQPVTLYSAQLYIQTEPDVSIDSDVDIIKFLVPKRTARNSIY